jgi:tight adherence protein B
VVGGDGRGREVTRAVALPLTVGSLLLVLLCAAALPLLRADQRSRKVKDRIAEYALPHARASAADLPGRSNATQSGGARQTVLRFLSRSVAFNPSHRIDYPLAWWLVLPLGLVAARLVVMLAQPLAGTSALGALPVMWLVLVRQFYRWCEQRRMRMLFEQFPDALAMLVRAVRVGIPIVEGIRSVAAESPHPTGHEFSQVVDQLALGVTLDEALQRLAERNPLPEYGFFATALGLQSETGGTVSDTLERLADVIRKRVALREHARALASEARTSIGILAALPVFTGGALALIAREYINTLFFDPQGQKVFASAVISFTVGIASMQLIVRRSLS